MKINIYQPRLEPWLDFIHGRCSGHFIWRWTICTLVKYKLASLLDIFSGYGRSDTNVIPSFSSCRESYFFPPASLYAQRSVEVASWCPTFLGRRFPRAAFVPPEWKLRNCRLNAHHRYTSKDLHQKRMQRRVRNPLINSSTAEWNNCISLR